VGGAVVADGAEPPHRTGHEVDSGKQGTGKSSKQRLKDALDEAIIVEVGHPDHAVALAIKAPGLLDAARVGQDVAVREDGALRLTRGARGVLKLGRRVGSRILYGAVHIVVFSLQRQPGRAADLRGKGEPLRRGEHGGRAGVFDHPAQAGQQSGEAVGLRHRRGGGQDTGEQAAKPGVDKVQALRKEQHDALLTQASGCELLGDGARAAQERERGALGLERRVARREVVEPERGILGGAQGEEAHEVGR
jgi:hypothetical protein